MFGKADIRRAGREAFTMAQDAEQAAAIQRCYDALLDALNGINSGQRVEAKALCEAISAMLAQALKDFRPKDRRRLLSYLAVRAEAQAQGFNLRAVEGAGIEIPAGASEH